MHDTRPDAAARHREAIRRLPPSERLRRALAMSDALRAASLEALRAADTPAMLTGSVAAAYLGALRSTLDVQRHRR
ncbi:MAG TPA: hypothetical protein PKE51_08105 [Gemmatimonadaceae bacterium]|nr:hypothetical protein [Gemmatimonadaceae bacterium]